MQNIWLLTIVYDVYKDMFLKSLSGSHLILAILLNATVIYCHTKSFFGGGALKKQIDIKHDSPQNAPSSVITD